MPNSRSELTSTDESYSRLVRYLNESHQYRANRLLGKLPPDAMLEARAILLGRMGKHEEALRIYIYRLKDYAAAEKFCVTHSTTIISATPATTSQQSPSNGITGSGEPRSESVFLLLLRMYLRPQSSDPVLLEPALLLIAKYSTRLDAEQVISLLPPLVTMKDVQDFFVKSLREGYAMRNERRVVKELRGARKEELERKVMTSQEKRVRVTGQRM